MPIFVDDEDQPVPAHNVASQLLYIDFQPGPSVEDQPEALGTERIPPAYGDGRSASDAAEFAAPPHSHGGAQGVSRPQCEAPSHLEQTAPDPFPLPAHQRFDQGAELRMTVQLADSPYMRRIFNPHTLCDRRAGVTDAKTEGPAPVSLLRPCCIGGGNVSR